MSITTLTIDTDAKDLIRKTQDVISNNKKINFDLKDLVYLIFKRPDKAAELVIENFGVEIDNK